MKNTNGKGSNPRSCFSPEFRDNHDNIDWGKKKRIFYFTTRDPHYRGISKKFPELSDYEILLGIKSSTYRERRLFTETFPKAQKKTYTEGGLHTTRAMSQI